MRALVVDDEALARRRLIRMLERIEGISICGEARDGQEALERIAELLPDVVFLDIQMPGLDGMELALLEDLPPVIFTTAHEEHAVRAFEANAVDYLLKPVGQERLELAITKLRGHADRAVRLRVQQGNRQHIVDARRVARFWADEKYSRFRYDGSDHLLDESLHQLQDRLAGLGFFRCHRAELVRLSAIVSLRREAKGYVAVLDDGQAARVSRRSLRELKAALG